MIRLKKILSEELDGYLYSTYEQADVGVYKNPTKISFLPKETRGLSFPNGDLYIVDSNLPNHYELAHKYFKISGFDTHKGVFFAVKKGYIPWMRYGDTNRFYLSDSVGDEYIDKLMPYIDDYVAKIKHKNPKLIFVKSILY